MQQATFELCTQVTDVWKMDMMIMDKIASSMLGLKKIYDVVILNV